MATNPNKQDSYLTLHAKRMEKEIGSIFELANVEGPKEYRGRIPEHIFVSYFLPFFREELKPEDMTEDKIKQREKILSDWLSIANTLFNEVVVIDNAGTELFVVPAMSNTDIFNPVRQDKSMTFSEIVGMAEKLQHMSPTKSTDYMNTNFESRLKEMRDKKHKFSKQEEQWMEIFLRYPLESEKNAPKGSSAAKSFNNLSDDDLDI